jgi:hypothetical protein
VLGQSPDEREVELVDGAFEIDLALAAHEQPDVVMPALADLSRPLPLVETAPTQTS